MSYERDWDLKDMAYEINSLDDGSDYDDGEYDRYLGDDEDLYPYGALDCE